MEANQQPDYTSMFDGLCDLVAQDTFQTDQNTYMDTHVGKFSDAEENKLEYTTVHEGYIFMCDKYIEAYLQGQQYDRDDLDNFYVDLKENFQTYHQRNADVCATLLDICDFQSFKKTILSMKEARRKEGVKS